MIKVPKHAGGVDFKSPEPGTYAARCARLVSLGSQPRKDFKTGQEKMVYQIQISWELVDTNEDFGQGPQPYMQSSTYTASMFEMASLRRDIESWFAKKMTDEQADDFDLELLIGKPCMLSLSAGKDPRFVNVSGVNPPPKGQVIAPLRGPTLSWGFEAPNYDVLKALPKRTVSKITTSPEWAALEGRPQWADKLAATIAAEMLERR